MPGSRHSEGGNENWIDRQPTVSVQDEFWNSHLSELKRFPIWWVAHWRRKRRLQRLSAYAGVTRHTHVRSTSHRGIPKMRSLSATYYFTFLCWIDIAAKMRVKTNLKDYYCYYSMALRRCRSAMESGGVGGCFLYDLVVVVDEFFPLRWYVRIYTFRTTCVFNAPRHSDIPHQTHISILGKCQSVFCLYLATSYILYECCVVLVRCASFRLFVFVILIYVCSVCVDYLQDAFGVLWQFDKTWAGGQTADRFIVCRNNVFLSIKR